KRGKSAINERIINIQKCTHRVTFEKYMGTPDVCIDSRLIKADWTKRIRNVPHCTHVQLCRKYNEDEDSPNKLYTLVTFVPVIIFKNLQTVNVEEN
ncbi:hypothetical protein FD755_024358, partial [Muntiacus reevesi]